MQKRDPLALGTDPGLVVDQLNSRCAAARERGIEVVHREANVVDSGAFSGDKSRYRRRFVPSLQQLDQRFPCRESRYARAITVFERHLR